MTEECLIELLAALTMKPALRRLTVYAVLFCNGTRLYGVPAPFPSYERQKLLLLTMLYNF